MKHQTLSFVMAALATSALVWGGAAHATDMPAEPSYEAVATTVHELKIVDAEQLHGMMEGNKQLIVIDSRSDADFATGHIPTAVSLRASEATPERLAKLIPTKDTPVVFYCGNIMCPASGKTAHKAAEAGYTNIYKYAAGMEDWQSKGLPVVQK